MYGASSSITFFNFSNTAGFSADLKTSNSFFNGLDLFVGSLITFVRVPIVFDIIFECCLQHKLYYMFLQLKYNCNGHNDMYSNNCVIKN